MRQPPARGAAPARGQAWRAVPLQLLIVVLGVVGYFGVRGLTASDAGTALAHARDLFAIERALGLDWEAALQGSIVGGVVAMAGYYLACDWNAAAHGRTCASSVLPTR